MASQGTYSGGVSPLRGLTPFAESESELFYGRENDIAELAHLVSANSFRAGLLYGENGVGKTSLLRAGLVPQLREQGLVVFLCEDSSDPVGTFTAQITGTTQLPMQPEESPMEFVSRAMASALNGQVVLFILDEVEHALDSNDEQVINELGELFARVVTRSGGRGRFLFSCASHS
ncbi:MAG: ATP-binding protein, partial [Myxococcota bacterium]